MSVKVYYYINDVLQETTSVTGLGASSLNFWYISAIVEKGKSWDNATFKEVKLDVTYTDAAGLTKNVNKTAVWGELLILNNNWISCSGTAHAYYTAPNSFTLSYSANGGEGAPEPSTKTSTESTYTFTISTDTPTRSNYNFLGWDKDSSASSATYSAGSEIKISPGTTTLYAVWQSQSKNYYYKVYASLLDSTNNIIKQNYSLIKDTTLISSTTNPELTLSTVPSISITGYYYSSMSSNTITSTDSSFPTIIYYRYKPNLYTVSYDANANDGTFTGSSTSRYYNESYTLTSTEPTRPGYNFLGWSTDRTATSASYSSGAVIPASTSTSNITYYAVWKKIYSILVHHYYVDENDNETT